MASRVIQGFFIGGAMRPQPAPRAAPDQAGPRHSAGAPPPAFAGRAAPLQARMAPGRPPLAHQGAVHVAQPHGGNGTFAIDPVQLGLARGGGKPLPQAVLSKMEAAFDADFSAVRVHVGPQAARIGAIAFTTGNDLYFAPGKFQPDSIQGQQLLGHELAHVIQQRQGRVRAGGEGLSVVQDRALEAEADRLGTRAAAHRAVQRKAAPGAAQRPSQVSISPTGLPDERGYKLVANAGGRAVGSVRFSPRGGVAEISDLGVNSEHRDRGVGKMLLASAARASLKHGASKISLSAQDNGSGKLVRWYKDLGFVQTGRNQRGFAEMEAPVSSLVQAKRAAGHSHPPVRTSHAHGKIQRSFDPSFSTSTTLGHSFQQRTTIGGWDGKRPSFWSQTEQYIYHGQGSTRMTHGQYMWAKMVNRDQMLYRCESCTDFYPVSSMNIDHVYPWDSIAKNYLNSSSTQSYASELYNNMKNLQLLCSSCNLSKSKAIDIGTDYSSCKNRVDAFLLEKKKKEEMDALASQRTHVIFPK